MSDWKVLERELLGDDPATVKAAAATLGGLDDDRARELLSRALGRSPPVSAAAAYALGSHGAKAVPLALAALDDPGRKAAAALALARIGAADAAPRLRQLVDDADAMVRLSAAIGLYKAGERSPALWSPWVAREPHVLVLGFLAAIAGTVTVDAPALTTLAAQAAEPSTAPEVRANCVWAVAAHDAARGTALAEGLDDAARQLLASIVARRGGPLGSAWGGGDAAADRTAETLGIPGVG